MTSEDFIKAIDQRINVVMSSPDFDKESRQAGLQLAELALLKDIVCSLRDIRKMLIEWRTYED